ncbi:MAG: hypothetical protein IH957_07940 [Chloroflexi bacterium]|nr:hypothetical protein [Chloroflexota bacterium]
MIARFKSRLALLAILPAIVAAMACGGGSSATLTLVADTSSLPPDSDSAEAIQQTADILLARAEIFDAGDAEVTLDGDTITATVSGMDREVAQLLLIPRGLLEFRQPVVNDLGFIICVDQNGAEFMVHPLRVNPDSATGNPARCFGEGQLGDPVWAATSTIFVVLDERSLHELIEPGSWQIENETTLVPRFTTDGSRLLNEVTTTLVGFPLAVFIDDLLIGAPRIRRPITDGRPFISGFAPFQARLYHAQLNAGPLPIPLTEATAHTE